MEWICPKCGTGNEDSLDTIQMEYVSCSECDKLFEIEIDDNGNIESIEEF